MNQSSKQTGATTTATTAKASNQPAYKRIQQSILTAIESGQLKAGEQIPTEMVLAEQFGVSRMTVNKAIAGLSQQHILTRIAGKGTFVTKQSTEFPLVHVVDFSEEVQMRGHAYRAVVEAHQTLFAYDEIALQLGVMQGSPVGFCRVLHFEDAHPLILENRYVNLAHVADFMQQDFTRITPTAFLLSAIPLNEIEHSVTAIAADNRLATTLKIPEATPCLQMTRRTWSGDVLVSYVTFLAAGSRYAMRSRYQVN